MPVFEIKSYNPLGILPEHHFYVLCKGLNSGKPLNAPCANCFVVSAGTKEETDALYWLSYAMWKGRGFHPLLRGAMIPFVTIGDYRRSMATALNSTEAAAEGLMKVVNVLKQLDEKEQAAKAQVKCITQLRGMILQKFIAMRPNLYSSMT